MTLTDRYVTAVTTRLPEPQRAEIEAELRASIADAVDAKIDAGEPADAAEATVLNELGDPERFAATYSDKPLYLIGPRLFLTWKRLVVLLLWIVVPIIGTLAALGSALDGDPFWNVFGATMSAMWGTALLIIFVVTVVFAAIERSGSEDDLPGPWTVANLKDAPQPTVTWEDTIGSALTIVITGAFLIWQQAAPWATTASGEGVPIINPDLWTFVLPALLAVMAVELVTVIVRHVRGHWTMKDWWLALAINVATLALLLPPLLQHTFLNRDFSEAVGWPDAASPVSLGQVELIIAAVVVLVTIVDVVTSFRKARRANR